MSAGAVPPTPTEQRVATILSRETSDGYGFDVRKGVGQGWVYTDARGYDGHPSDADVCDAIEQVLLKALNSPMPMKLYPDGQCDVQAWRFGFHYGQTKLAALMQALCNAFPEGE